LIVYCDGILPVLEKAIDVVSWDISHILNCIGINSGADSSPLGENVFNKQLSLVRFIIISKFWLSSYDLRLNMFLVCVTLKNNPYYFNNF